MAWKVGGVVLCGGRSSRMGTPKAWLPFVGETMLARVVRVVGEGVGGPVVVVAAPGQDVPPLADGVRVVHDPEEGRGPLAGLAAGLAALDGAADAVYLSSCDVPFLRPAFVRRVAELLGEASVCVPEHDGRFHPLAGVYRLSVRGEVERLLAADRRRPVFLFESVPTRFVHADDFRDADAGMESLRNVNTPEEYEAAARVGVRNPQLG